MKISILASAALAATLGFASVAQSQVYYDPDGRHLSAREARELQREREERREDRAERRAQREADQARLEREHRVREAQRAQFERERQIREAQQAQLVRERQIRDAQHAQAMRERQAREAQQARLDHDRRVREAQRESRVLGNLGLGGGGVTSCPGGQAPFWSQESGLMRCP